MGKQMSIRELRAALTDLEQHLNEHGEIILTRHGKEIARIGGPVFKAKPKLKDASELHDILRVSMPEGFNSLDVLNEIRGRY
ncbi:MAG: hypothetical protein AAGH90_02235 [Pseudomonadota bacterium]